MWRLFCPREYRGQNKRHGFLEEGKEGPFDRLSAGEERFCVLSHLLLPALSSVEGLDEFLQEGLRELWLTVLRQAEFPQHFRAERVFSVPLCLERSGW